MDQWVTKNENPMVRLSYNFPYDNQTRAQSKTTSRNLKENYLTKPKKKNKTKQNKTDNIKIPWIWSQKSSRCACKEEKDQLGNMHALFGC